MINSSHLTNFLLNKGFSVFEENEQGQFVTLQHDGLYIRILKELDGKFFLELSRANNSNWEGWYDMDVVRFLIQKAPYSADAPSDFEYLSQFFIDHYEEIRETFSPYNFSYTETSFATLKNQRAKALFGYE